MVEYNMVTDHLSSTFAALADPTRRAILARLATGEATVTDLAQPFKMSLPGFSKHLKVLEKAGQEIVSDKRLSASTEKLLAQVKYGFSMAAKGLS